MCPPWEHLRILGANQIRPDFLRRAAADWRKEQKYDFLDQKGDYSTIPWQEIEPDKNYTWLTEGLEEDFETFLTHWH